jgi:MHS family shikimate/dehydroshikimate transporter-like MFS transporter
MDSTLISDRPNEETPSLNRARRAASAASRVPSSTGMIFCSTALPPRWCLTANFPQVSPAMGTLAAFATFGVGFLFRPLGGVIFGHFGDRLGRKRMLMLTVWMMGIATALIGILPRLPLLAGGHRYCWSPCAPFRASPLAVNGAARRCCPLRARRK